jgi:hypothetical protein
MRENDQMGFAIPLCGYPVNVSTMRSFYSAIRLSLRGDILRILQVHQYCSIIIDSCQVKQILKLNILKSFLSAGVIFGKRVSSMN